MRCTTTGWPGCEDGSTGKPPWRSRRLRHHPPLALRAGYRSYPPPQRYTGLPRARWQPLDSGHIPSRGHVVLMRNMRRPWPQIAFCRRPEIKEKTRLDPLSLGTPWVPRPCARRLAVRQAHGPESCLCSCSVTTCAVSAKGPSPASSPPPTEGQATRRAAASSFPSHSGSVLHTITGRSG